MKSARLKSYNPFILVIFTFCAFAFCSENQNSPSERTFSKSKAEVEKVLKAIQSSVSGRLPALEGFVMPGERPLDRFQRAYYQCAVQVTSLPSGESRVRVNAKITAWYRDPVSARSGYQALPSNGRIETDLLDQIADALGSVSPAVNSESPSISAPISVAAPQASGPGISAPMPRIPEDSLLGSPVASPNGDTAGSLTAQSDAAEKREQELAAEAKGLEEILQNQAHPNNLVAVKKTGTPILQGPNADARILFTATAGDEFEILDVNSNWIHVRISGLSRGWIRQSLVEMPEDFSVAKQPGAQPQNSAEEFRVSHEQVAPFPGDWEPLRGKIVKIITVQKTQDSANNTGAQAKLQFAKALFMKEYSSLATTTDAPPGIVLIFDADDGGLVAATLSTLKEWKAGALSDAAGWKQCFFDPPELFGSTASPAGSSAR